MADSSQQAMFSQIDVTNIVSPSAPINEKFREEQRHAELLAAFRDLATLQQRQNELLTQLINQQNAAQRQRTHELQMWKTMHPELAKGCRELLGKMSNMQTEYFTRMVEDSAENGEDWGDSEFMFNDFVDRFGPRLIYLNGLLQALSQLAAPTEGRV